MRYSLVNRSSLSSLAPVASATPDRQELAGEVPLVERFGGVDSLVALQPDQRGVEHRSQRLRRFGLANSGLTLQEKRVWEPRRAEQGGGDAVVGQVSGAVEPRPGGRQATRSPAQVGSMRIARRVIIGIREERFAATGSAEPHDPAVLSGSGCSMRIASSDTSTDMPQIGSTSVHTSATTGLPAPGDPGLARDDLGQDRQGDLLGGACSYVETGWSVNAVLQVLADRERRDHRCTPPSTGDEAHVGDPRLQPRRPARRPRPCRATPRRVPRRPRRCRLGRPTSCNPAAPPIVKSADVVGVSPTTWTSGGGSTGSRKISRVPPDRQGLCTTRLPGCSGSGVGVIRSSTVCPDGRRAQGLLPHRSLGAVAADEALHRSIDEDYRLVTWLGRGWGLGQDHPGVDEGESGGAQSGGAPG